MSISGTQSPISIAYTPDGKMPEGRSVISLSIDFSLTPRPVIDLASITSLRTFSGVKGVYIEFDTSQNTPSPFTLRVQSTGQIITLDNTTASCAYVPLVSTPNDKFFLSANTGKANLCFTNFEIKPLRYRVR